MGNPVRLLFMKGESERAAKAPSKRSHSKRQSKQTRKSEDARSGRFDPCTFYQVNSMLRDERVEVAVEVRQALRTAERLRV